MDRSEILNDILVELFNHILYLEEQNLQLKGINLTMNEIHTIETVRNVDDPTMGNIAKKLIITLGTLTTVVKRLEAKGYIKRSKCEDDARIVRVELLPEAYEVLAVHDEFHENMIDTVLTDLDDEEEKVLLSGLIKVKDYFERTKI